MCGSCRGARLRGDNVNVTARLASAAAGGEILVTEAAAHAAGVVLDGPAQLPERRRLELRGKAQSTDVFVLTLAGRQGPITS